VAIEQETTRLPVRSALFKQRTDGLVVRWVTTSEYPLLYVFFASDICLCVRVHTLLAKGVRFVFAIVTCRKK
jgi:hypothetical protein